VEHSRRNDLVGAGLIGLMALQFGSVVILGKIATKPGGLPVPSLLAFRFAIAAAVLAGAARTLGRPLLAAPGERVPIALLGVFGYGVEAGFFFASLRHGTAAAITLLFYTYPVLVLVLGVAVGRGFPGWLLGGALVTAVGGAALVATAGQGVDVNGVGVLLALASAGTYSVYLIGAERAMVRTDPLTSAAWVAAWASVGMAVAALISGTGTWPRGWHQWGPLIGISVFTAGAFACLFGGLRRLGALRTAILSATEPLTASVLAAVFLDEGIRGWTAIGGGLILAGAIAASAARGKPVADSGP
jgi:drug/metabolite transporter (DMT)-like permease